MLWAGKKYSIFICYEQERNTVSFGIFQYLSYVCVIFRFSSTYSTEGSERVSYSKMHNSLSPLLHSHLQLFSSLPVYYWHERPSCLKSSGPFVHHQPLHYHPETTSLLFTQIRKYSNIVEACNWYLSACSSETASLAAVSSPPPPLAFPYPAAASSTLQSKIVLWLFA